MIQKIEKFMNHRYWNYLAFFSIGYGIALSWLFPFPSLLLVIIWSIVLFIDRKKL